MLSFYLALKFVHILFACVSLTLFLWRAIRHLRGRSAVVWSRQLPRVIDSGLLATAIGLMLMTGMYPGRVNWLTVKLLLVLTYILLGMMVLHWTLRKPMQIATLALAVICFTAIVYLAFHKPLL